MSVDFNVRHFDWERMVNRWKMAWDYLRGGIHVLCPDHTVYVGRRAVKVRTAGDSSSGTQSELSRHDSVYQWVPASYESYLWRHDRETEEEWEDRQRRLYHLNNYRSVLNIYASGILRTPPIREERGIWEKWHRNVDRRGTNIDVLMRRALTQSFGFGRIHSVIDRPRTFDVVRSAYEAELVGDPFAYLVTPLDVVDWVLDDDGQPLWVVVRRDAPETRGPGQKQPEPVSQYLVLTRDTVAIYREVDDEERKQGGEKFEAVLEPMGHDLNRVPFSTLWVTEEDRDRVMCCESPFGDLLDLDRHLLNKTSEIDETERSQTFALLGIPVSEGGPPGEIVTGHWRAFTYDAQAGAPSYISPDPSLAMGKWQRIESQIQMGRTLDGASRGRAEYSKEERSASSLILESEDKRNRMTWFASALEEFDIDIHEVVAKMFGTTPPKVNYNKVFDFRSNSALVGDIVQLSTVKVDNREVLSGKAAAALVKQPVSRILHECGQDAAAIKVITDDIDKRAEEPPPPPPAPVMPFGQPPQDQDEPDEEGADGPA